MEIIFLKQNRTFFAVITIMCNIYMFCNNVSSFPPNSKTIRIYIYEQSYVWYHYE